MSHESRAFVQNDVFIKFYSYLKFNVHIFFLNVSTKNVKCHLLRTEHPMLICVLCAVCVPGDTFLSPGSLVWHVIRYCLVFSSSVYTGENSENILWKICPFLQNYEKISQDFFLSNRRIKCLNLQVDENYNIKFVLFNLYKFSDSTILTLL